MHGQTRIPFAIVPILSVAFCLYPMIELSAATHLPFLLWVAAALVLYFGFSLRHSLLARPDRGGLSCQNPLRLTLPLIEGEPSLQ
jgi:APA family basic amino acid/polyamine antiporter